MKTLIKLSLIASLVLVFFGCKDEGGETDTRLSAVKILIEPTDSKSIVLQTAASATAYFEWEYCNVDNTGTAVYQIAFDKSDGDFSNPVYLTSADNNGLFNHATISHKQLNKIAGMMGIGASGTGGFKWTVFSSKGTKTLKAEKENLITVTRLAGFADIPIDVYLTGEGSEGGTDITKAHKMKAVAGGEFEVFTKLKAGKTFNFTDGTKGTPRVFYTDKGLVKENGSTTIANDGIYRITLDFNTGACTYTLVTRVSFYFSPEGKILFDLPYVGYGVFQGKNQTVTFKQEGWGRDERYKFRMFVKENSGADAEKELELCTLNSTDSRPNATSPASYYYVLLTSNVTQWDNKWKLMGDFDGVPADYTLYLQADTPYTHSIKKN